MAGSSMDGLDLCLATFTKKGKWQYSIERCDTIPYEHALYEKLKGSHRKTAKEQQELDVLFGNWIGETINIFLSGEKPELLAVHGHTVRHAPHEKVSWQLGEGKRIATVTGIPTITDFRSLDVQNGGQGAPLVPFGDFELFSEADACLNLGGIANISIAASKTAWDICPCNQVLNQYSNTYGREYDEGGDIARTGELDSTFISNLKEISFFQTPPPKSLPNSFIPLELLQSIPAQNGLRTYIEFISLQIKADLTNIHPGKLLVSGGGVFNSFMMERIASQLPDWQILVPEANIISYKEALIFAFLGLMKMQGKVNVLRSVTGASKDSCSGTIHLP